MITVDKAKLIIEKYINVLDIVLFTLTLVLMAAHVK